MSPTVRIVQTEDVLHGKPRIEGTRMGVFTLGVAAREHGVGVEELTDEYPALDREQIEAALDYYDEHPELMEYIRAQKRLRKQEIVAQSRAPATGEDTDS
jgi:uncharacterized protein (DUF433 family)